MPSYEVRLTINGKYIVYEVRATRGGNHRTQLSSWTYDNIQHAYNEIEEDKAKYAPERFFPPVVRVVE